MSKMLFTDDEQHYRPRVNQYENGSKFCVDDEVYVTSGGRGLLGPYIVARVVMDSLPVKYELSHGDGSSVDDGKEFDENELEAA
ncbi:hypothetical protein QBC40DRAFT_271697 [Triangularia verruculosa]|uniref:Uncharacterized protein n=1 Tax=Triangularia verruculosa TaxID=2587418 RepID=A0AAN6XT88_9PEZI|nr:hypothetical protein QBC40DRAFT_271697 [Triangularia verruculosa]